MKHTDFFMVNDASRYWLQKGIRCILSDASVMESPCEAMCAAHQNSSQSSRTIWRRHRMPYASAREDSQNPQCCARMTPRHHIPPSNAMHIPGYVVLATIGGSAQGVPSLPIQLPSLGDTYGALFIGMCFCILLYGLTLHQTYRYFRLYPKDRPLLKILVRKLLASNIYAE
ncbi:hypothetical protein BD413DRAFT_271539 [Trametes elegans]|nr:hypothetical protein BD413DRAFT_271539 [Trametes elegans]